MIFGCYGIFYVLYVLFFEMVNDEILNDIKDLVEFIKIKVKY